MKAGRLAIVICASALGFPGAEAQTTTATLKGTVRTADGSPASSLVVEARSESTGVQRVAITDSAGRYRIDLLQPGSWTVLPRRAASDGQAGDPLADARRVTLRLQQTVILDFTAGAVAVENVIVRADTPLVDPTRTGSELRVDGAQVEELPISGRLVTDLALLDSSVVSAPAGNFFGERGSVFVVNGQSGRANSFLLDGLDNNDQTSNTTLNAFLSQQVIREFVVLTHQYAPEFGRASGGILNVITERGGNDVTGGGFLQGSSASLNSAGEFVDGLSDSDGIDDTGGRYQAGLKVGGPLRRDTASYFAAFEHQQADDVTPFTGVGRDGSDGGWVTAPSRDDNLFLRTDFNLGTRHFLMARLSADDRETNDINVGGRVTPETGFSLDERDVQLAGSLTSTISPALLNEVRLLAGRSTFDQTANSDRPGVDRPSGVFGGNNLNQQNRDEDRIQIVDNITWQNAPHTLKLGVDVLRTRTHVSTRFNPSGNFQYDTDDPFEPGDCGDIISSQVDPNNDRAPIDCPGQVGVDDDGDGVVDEPGYIYTYPFVYTLIEGAPSATIHDTRMAAFAQDSWQVGPNFLLDYGVRYDLSTFRLPEDTAVDSTVPNGGAGRDANNLAPRFGFTWTPRSAGLSGRFIVRGGGGIFYDKLVLGFPAVAAITSGTQIGLYFPRGFTVELTEDLVEELGADVIKNELFFPPELILQFSTGTRLDTPYTTQYSLGVEHAVGHGGRGAWSANLTRALGYHQALFRDLNPVVTTDINGIPIHRDPAVGSIAAIVTEGRTWYTGLDLGWKWRGEDAWYSASYTWSKALDEGPDPLKGGISLPPFCLIELSQNSSNKECPSSLAHESLSEERGRTDSDRRHRFVVAGAAPLVWLGLRASGVIQFASGIPFNVTTGGDENIDGITTDRPVGVGRNTGERTSLKAINKARAAALLPPISLPNEPSFSQVDLRLSRPFTFKGDGNSSEFFLQVFNLLDRFNPGVLEGAVTSRRFGEPTGQAGPPRTLEVGLKISF